MHTFYIMLLATQRHIFHSPSLHTNAASGGFSDHHTNIHSHLHGAMWVKCRAQGHNGTARMEWDSNCQPSGCWMTCFNSWANVDNQLQGRTNTNILHADLHQTWIFSPVSAVCMETLSEQMTAAWRESRTPAIPRSPPPLDTQPPDGGDRGPRVWRTRWGSRLNMQHFFYNWSIHYSCKMPCVVCSHQ